MESASKEGTRREKKKGSDRSRKPSRLDRPLSRLFSCRFSFVQVSFRSLLFQFLNTGSLLTRSDVLMTTELLSTLMFRWLGQHPPRRLAVPMLLISKCLPQLLHTTSLPDCVYPFGPQTSHVSKATCTLPSVPFTAKNLTAVPFDL